MKAGLLIGLVVIIHQASSFRLGGGCGGPLCGSCGCGFPYPNHEKCPGSELLYQGDWCDGPNKNCVPLVVRPHELPKPVVSPITAAELNNLVPGPCTVKKAIVKPAILSKPVCRPRPAQFQSCHSACSTGCASSCSSSVNGLGFLSGSCGFPGGLIGPNGALLPGGVAGPNGQYSLGAGAPADAVSIDLALKLAHQNLYSKMMSEDKLNFGFRKIPLEIPAKKIIRNDIPEEGIFSLNGQVVELKPIKACGTGTTLEEEAAEQLLRLQDEEEEELFNEGTGPLSNGPRIPTLGEVGFGAAKPPKPNLVDIPASAASAIASAVGIDSCEVQAVNDISTNCGCGGQLALHSQSSNCGCHSCHSCGCEEKYSCKVIPGNVEYKTLPKPQQICIPPPVIPDSCESGELELSLEEAKPQCSCIPVCVKNCNKNCRKSCFHLEKFN